MAISRATGGHLPAKSRPSLTRPLLLVENERSGRKAESLLQPNPRQRLGELKKKFKPLPHEEVINNHQF
jgi:hypothetical protein